MLTILATLCQLALPGASRCGVRSWDPAKRNAFARAGSAAQVLPSVVSAPSTLRTRLRSFSWGHVRQFDRADELALGRAWSVGAAPEVAEMTVGVLIRV